MICSIVRRFERLRDGSRPSGVESLSLKSFRCIEPAGSPAASRNPPRQRANCQGLAET